MKERARQATYRANNREAHACHQRNRISRKKAASGTHTAADIARLFESQLGKCVYCKTSIEDKYHVDHIIPLAAGGSNDRLNIQLLCPSCNLSKGTKMPEEFIEYRKILA